MMVSTKDGPTDNYEVVEDVDYAVNRPRPAVTRRASRFCSIRVETPIVNEPLSNNYMGEISVPPGASAYQHEDGLQHSRCASPASLSTECGYYKFYSGTWRRLCTEDVVALNAALLGTHATSGNSLVELMSRFFPHHPLSTRAVASVHLTTLRGHPVTVEFSGIPPQLYETTVLASTEPVLTLDSLQPPNVDSYRGVDVVKSCAARCPPSEPPFSALPAMTPTSRVEESRTVGLCLSPSMNAPGETANTRSLPSTTSVTTSMDDSPICDETDGNFNSECYATVTEFPDSHCDANAAVPSGGLPYNDPASTFRVTFEFSAGLCVTRCRCDPIKGSRIEALVIRRNDDAFYEIPKGHLEEGETLEQAAERELREETGFLNPVVVSKPILSEIYTVKAEDRSRVEKTVHYFGARLQPLNNYMEKLGCTNITSITPTRDGACCSAPHLWTTDNDKGASCGASVFTATPRALSQTSGSPLSPADAPDAAWFGAREAATQDIKWVALEEARALYWKSNTIRKVVLYTLLEHFETP